ncbi:MAG: TraR/DksA family transcriptional regulator [Candidatus Eiseniibacteriota bacterium]
MTALDVLERDLQQRLRDIHLRLAELHPRASAEITADLRRNDLCDSAQATVVLEAQTVSVERLTLEAQQIAAALERIADGTYGQCLECGEPIAAARLKAIPTATLCVICQSAAEVRTSRAVRARQAASDHEEAPYL